MRHDNRPELEDSYEVPRERLAHIDNGVVRLEEARNRRFGAPAVVDQYAAQAEQYLAPTYPETPVASPDNVIDIAAERARRLAAPAQTQEWIHDKEAA